MIVVWSENAENTLKKTAEYILEKFGEKNKVVFIEEVYKTEGMEGLRNLVVAENYDFSIDTDYRKHLINDMPKVGNIDATADRNLCLLFNIFADSSMSN